MITGFILVFILGPIAQPKSYHQFSDSRAIRNIPNFLNVISNLPFLLLGLFAIHSLSRNKLQIVEELKLAYMIMFGGVILLALGSAYYHLWPNNQTLAWDRIPMTIVFMSLFTIIIAEYISISAAKRLLWPLLIIGISSVIYWQMGERFGKGDLRFYVLVQFLPILMIPIILVGFKSSYSQGYVYWWLLLCYLFAKVFEHFDRKIHILLDFISGHSLKHLLAALGIWMLMVSYSNRKKLN